MLLEIKLSLTIQLGTISVLIKLNMNAGHLHCHWCHTGHSDMDHRDLGWRWKISSVNIPDINQLNL